MTLSMPERSPLRTAPAVPPGLADGLAIIAARTIGRGPDADDAVQEILARTVAAVREGRVPEGVPVAVFAYGIARHVLADVHRERARHAGATVDAASLPAPHASPLDELIATEERDAMARALATLSPADQDLLRACYVTGERLTAIAARLGQPAERIRKRKSRALERLRQALEAGGGARRHVRLSRPIIPT